MILGESTCINTAAVCVQLRTNLAKYQRNRCIWDDAQPEFYRGRFFWPVYKGFC